jgi:aspartate kinase
MALVVQKFGGTSVANSQMILSAARKAIRAHQDGDQVVVVVSAMGKNTDLLVQLANEVNENPPAREMDMLLATGEQVSVALMAMAIDNLGYKAVSLTGAQIGIRTDSSHTKARIRSISTDRVQQLLHEGNIVIAAGFQGIDDHLDITTLGRGGSDTTAVALAAVLGAKACQIYTDVDGVYTTDPRILPEARLTKQVSYDEMLELASLGAGVMHSRSIEFGKKFNVPIHVRSSLSDMPGSVISQDPESPDQPVSGAALTRDESRITILGVPDLPGTSQRIFGPLAAQKITVDMIVQNPSDQGTADISFTVPKSDFARTANVVETICEELGGQVGYSEEVSKVSVVGLGMAEQSGVANRMFRALANADVNLQMITTSEIKISVLVDRAIALQALRAVHLEFDLATPPKNSTEAAIPLNTSSQNAQSTPVTPAEVVERLQDIEMEGLTIDTVYLDNSQSRITLSKTPNQPGIAAKVFERVAEHEIFVDMIVQSYFDPERADISFTVDRSQCEKALEITKSIAKEIGSGEVDFKREIAKLTVQGIGLRSHTGVATAMFETLADAEINLEMINTSEVRVNVVVDGSQGELAKDLLREKFNVPLGG